MRTALTKQQLVQRDKLYTCRRICTSVTNSLNRVAVCSCNSGNMQLHHILKQNHLHLRRRQSLEFVLQMSSGWKGEIAFNKMRIDIKSFKEYLAAMNQQQEQTHGVGIPSDKSFQSSLCFFLELSVAITMNK